MFGNLANILYDDPEIGRLKRFDDLDYDYRKKKLESTLVAGELLGKMPSGIREVFIQDFLYHDPNPEFHKILKEYFSFPKVSIPASKIISHKPSSHWALQAIYDKWPRGQLDNYFYASPAGDAIPNRLNTVIEQLPHWIRRSGAGKEKIKVAIPGSGPAVDIVRILAGHEDLREKVQVYCIDNEKDAIQFGENLAEMASLSDSIKFIHGDFMKEKLTDMDIVLLVGIICPVPDNVSVRIIKWVKNYCRPGGLVVVSAALKKMLFEDPVTCFIMDIIGWALNFRTEDQAWSIIQKAGLNPLDSFTEKYGYHLMTVAEK